MNSATFQPGYILNRRGDAIWFLGLPYLAILFALSCQMWLPAVALASISLWITIPHHFATWLRTYGFKEDLSRWTQRLIVGPIVIFTLTILGAIYIPITFFIVNVLWDHQHSIMQQHGFSRIYDYKSGTGTRRSGRFDLGFHWIFFGNMLITSPLFSTIWLGQFAIMGLLPEASTVQLIHTFSWGITGCYGIFYVIQLIQGVRQGQKINPIKYIFIGSSYFLWYFCAWHSSSVLVWGIAHRIMHGLQYIVIVYWYLRRRAESDESAPSNSPQGDKQIDSRVEGLGFKMVRYMVGSKRVWVFVGISLAYAALFQIILMEPLEVFGFGVFRVSEVSRTIESLKAIGMTDAMWQGLYAEILVAGFGMTHFYFDSFIWKVRDKKVQKGL